MAASSPQLGQAVLSALLLVAVLLLYLGRFGAPRRWVGVALGVCLADQMAKALVSPALARREVPLLGGHLRLSYFENTQQGFGGTYSYLLLTTVVCVAALFFLYGKLIRTRYRMSMLVELGCALMIGGYVGILLDRVRLGFVVDFLEFGRASEFVYNLADLAVLLAAAVLLARGLQYLGELRRRGVRLRDPVL